MNHGVLKIDGDYFQPNFEDPKYMAGAALLKNGGDAKKAAHKLRNGMTAEMPEAQEAARLLDAGVVKSAERPAPRILQVKIAKDLSTFVDWDKPFSQQSPFVQNAIEKAGLKPGPGSDPLGQEIYYHGSLEPEELADIHAENRAFSKRLSDVGISGVTYADSHKNYMLAQPGRAYDGVRNYVVFDDRHVHITHKDGALLPKTVALPDYLRGEARGNIAYQAPDYGGRTVSARMSVENLRAYGGTRDAAPSSLGRTLEDIYVDAGLTRHESAGFGNHAVTAKDAPFDAPLPEKLRSAVAGVAGRRPDFQGSEANVYVTPDGESVLRVAHDVDAPRYRGSRHVLQPVAVDQKHGVELLPRVLDAGSLKDFPVSSRISLAEGLAKDGLMIVDDGHNNFGYHHGRLVAVDPGAIAPIKAVVHGTYHEDVDLPRAVREIGATTEGGFDLQPYIDAARQHTVSSRMHAPEIVGALGQDVPGTLVRPYGGPLERSQRPAGIVAYHGSPHDFDRFSSAHIGKGEGNATYSHGLYFAENRAVAENYREALSLIDPDIHSGASTMWQRAAAFVHRNSSIDNKTLDGILELGFENESPRARKQAIDFARKYVADNRAKSNTYQVRIGRDQSHFLDWDKPFSQQSPYVQSRLRSAGITEGETGREIYWGLTDDGGKALASSKLRDTGIAGVRYLDAGSRDVAGNATHNLVTFNDHDIQVTHKNDVPLARPVALPDYLKGEARGAFVKELVSAGMNPESFSRDLRIRADRFLKPGMHLDHGVAFTRAAVERAPREVQDAVLGRAAESGRGETARNGSEAGNAVQGPRGLPSASQGLRRPDPTGGAPGQATTRFQPEDVANYRAATAATRDRAQTFDEGTAGKILKPAGRGGYAMADAAVPGAVVPHGKPTDAAAVRQFLAAGGTPEALADATAYSVRSQALRPDGTMDPNKVHKYLAQNAGAFAEMPPEVAARFKTVADTQAAVDEMVARHERDVATFNKSALGQIAGLQHGEDVVKTIGGIFGRADAVQRFKALATAAGADPAAKEGLRRAVVEFMIGKLTSNASINASEMHAIKGDTYLGFMRKNGAALRQVFEKKELDTMAAIGADIDRSLRTHQTKGLTSSPGTAQDIGAPASILGEIGKELGPTGLAFASHMAGSHWLTSILGFLGAKTVGRMRAAGLDTANALVTKAMLDPVLAKRLLAKVPDAPDRGTAQALGDQLVRLSRSTAAGLYGSSPDQRSNAH